MYFHYKDTCKVFMGKGLTKFVGEIPYMWDIVFINTPVLLGEELDNQFMHSI